MSLNILGLAGLVPSYMIDQDAAAEFAHSLSCFSTRQRRALSALYARTRIKTRSSCLLEETDGRTSHSFYHPLRNPEDLGPPTSSRMEKYELFAGRLATKACREALGRAKVAARGVTHLVTVTCTGFYAPGFDFQVIRELGLPKTVQRMQVGFMGCQAVLNALRIAAAIASSDPTARILICSVELCSLHFQYGWHPDRVVSNALFADGAGAIVGGASHRLDGDEPHWQVTGTGSILLPDSADAMTWRIGDHGFVMTLSPRIPDLIGRFLSGWIDEWLSSLRLSRKQIESWAIHPGGPRILRAAETALSLPKTRTKNSRQVLTDFGNMSSATMIFILERLILEKAPRPCVALGFGPGLTVEAILFE